MLKVKKTTVRRSDQVAVPGQDSACARCAVPKERMSPKTCPFLTLSTIFVTGHENTMCRQISPSSGGPHCPSGASDLCFAPHLKQLHMLALWGGLWSRLGFRFGNGFGLPFPWDKPRHQQYLWKSKACPQTHGQGSKPHGPLWPTQSALHHSPQNLKQDDESSEVRACE